MIILLILTGCRSSVSGVNDSQGAFLSTGEQPAIKTIHYLAPGKESTGTTKIISDLAREYSEKHPSVQFEFESISQVEIMQRVQLLAASNDLPSMFAFEAGRPLQDMKQEVLDIEKTFKDLGLFDKLNSAAVNLLKRQVGGSGLYAIPLEVNIEGFWYNKKMFEDAQMKVPTTWDEMLQAAEAFKRKGIQPFAVAGQEKWPLTRFIGAYVLRKYGADVMNRVDKGQLKVTDPGFIEAAQTVKQMESQGYFGNNVTKVNYDAALDLFLLGKAAMFYMGSWELSDYNDPIKNKIGKDNIGFFNTPLVKEGKGSLADYSMNTGLTLSFSKTAYDPSEADWMKAIFGGYGNRAISDTGMLTGFKVDRMPAKIPTLTKMVQRKLDEAQEGALWFEALFDTKTQSIAWDNAQLLVTGDDMSAQEYMFELQKALDEQGHK
jgi:raffinose/stachyose/melibiose transport system substrate-binding protein